MVRHRCHSWWLCINVYKALGQNDRYFIDNLSKNPGELTYDKTNLIGDNNSPTDNKNISMNSLYEYFQPGMFVK